MAKKGGELCNLPEDSSALLTVRCGGQLLTEWIELKTDAGLIDDVEFLSHLLRSERYRQKLGEKENVSSETCDYRNSGVIRNEGVPASERNGRSGLVFSIENDCADKEDHKLTIADTSAVVDNSLAARQQAKTRRNLQLKCKYCHLLFDSKMAIKSHNISKCGQDFNQNTTKGHHQKQLESDSQEGTQDTIDFPNSNAGFQGLPCKATFPTADRREEHLSQSDSTEITVSIRRGRLKRGRRLKVVQTSLSCDQCGKGLSTAGAKLTHAMKHARDDGLFYCIICPKAYNQSNECVAHYKTEHEEERQRRRRKVKDGAIKDSHRKRFSCGLCSRSFDRKSDFVAHTNSHNGLLPFPCLFCSKGFAAAERCKRHEDTCRQNPERKLPGLECGVCGKKFMFPKELEVHANTHGVDRPFNCSLCDKTFRSRRAQREHERVHTGTKQRYSCKFCDKTFCGSQVRSNHQRACPLNLTKTAEFQCGSCGKQFLKRESLRKHEKRHTGVRLFGCPMCSRRFFTNTELIKHNASHSTDESFACMYCGKTFKYRYNCNAHIKTAHPEKIASYLMQ